MDTDVLQAANPCCGQGAMGKKLQEERENGKEDDKEEETQQEFEEEQVTQNHKRNARNQH